jgi:tetratricopeptide (TPR) repeat protein
MLKRSFLKLLALAPLSVSTSAVLAQTPEDFLKTASEARQHFSQGIDCHIFQNFSGAIEEFTKALELAPDFAAVYENRAYDLYNSGKRQEAIDDFETAIRLYAQQGDLAGVKNAKAGLEGITLGYWERDKARLDRNNLL